MTAAEVYRVLSSELDAPFGEHGFGRVRASPLAYQLPHAGEVHMVWFQMDSYGWDRWAGSRFFVNFRVAASAGRDVHFRREERLNHFLTDGELEAARALRDDIVARIPRPPQEYFEQLRKQLDKLPDGAAMLAAMRAQFEPETLPYRRHQDFGLRYFQPADVTQWAGFIAGLLPRATEAMHAW